VGPSEYLEEILGRIEKQLERQPNDTSEFMAEDENNIFRLQLGKSRVVKNLEFASPHEAHFRNRKVFESFKGEI